MAGFNLIKNNKKMNVGKSIYLMLPAVFLIGCTSPATYRTPITQFQEASAIVIEGAKVEYGMANKRERDAVIDRKASKRYNIDLDSLTDDDSIILSPADLSLRINALDALGKHAQLLLILANSDAPAKSAAAANAFGSSVSSLLSELSKASPISNPLADPVKAFSAIAGEVINLVLEKKITQALDKSIIASDKNVMALINQLRTETIALYERHLNKLSESRRFATKEYNLLLSKPNLSFEELGQAVLRIKKAEDAYRDMSSSSVAASFDAMSDAHQKLVDYAKSPKRPQDLAELIEATESLVNKAKIITEALKTLRNTKE